MTPLVAELSHGLHLAAPKGVPSYYRQTPRGLEASSADACFSLGSLARIRFRTEAGTFPSGPVPADAVDHSGARFLKSLLARE